ncbi:MAG TPA: hypothetical protein VMK83_11195 [Gaiellaceae bacterium]|nr:hypothetical protein [Gaiellaceae bacterium]
MKRVLPAVGVALATLLVVGTAVAARAYSDPAGDVNTAPDITAVEVSEAAAGVLRITVAIANFQSLPENSWVNLWFDTDSNQDTGAEGDEALVRYLASGGTEVYTWNGSQLVQGTAAGAAASFDGGVLTVVLPRSSIGASTAFGLLVVTSRGQRVGGGDEQLIASDFAPNTGRLTFAGDAPAAVADPVGDHDAAPDITAVRVSDAKNGWITFAITTPNYAELPEASAVVVSIDADANARTGDSGADLQLTLAAGQIAMERWDGRQWAPDDLPTRARFRNVANVVSIDVHVSELGNSPRFRFRLLAADVNTATQGVVALDVAPDDFSYWSYTLANKPAVSLVARSLSATPGAPRAGQRFAVALPVTRSDTGRSIRSGSVACQVRVAGRLVAARGSLAGGAARCSLVVPAAAQGTRLRGTITVRSGGARVVRAFAYLVR